MIAGLSSSAPGPMAPGMNKEKSTLLCLHSFVIALVGYWILMLKANAQSQICLTD